MTNKELISGERRAEIEQALTSAQNIDVSKDMPLAKKLHSEFNKLKCALADTRTKFVDRHMQAIQPMVDECKIYEKRIAATNAEMWAVVKDYEQRLISDKISDVDTYICNMTGNDKDAKNYCRDALYLEKKVGLNTNVNDLIERAEKIFSKYTKDLNFLLSQDHSERTVPMFKQGTDAIDALTTVKEAVRLENVFKAQQEQAQQEQAQQAQQAILKPKEFSKSFIYELDLTVTEQEKLNNFLDGLGINYTIKEQ